MRRKRRVARIMFRLGLAVGLLLGLDYFVFSYVRVLDASDEARVGHADAIVVFSGDPARVIRGFDLLARGAAPRLLVAGLDNGTDIAAERRKRPDLSICCVDVEAASGTTHEDAAAITHWARARGVESLIVVTTNIHMPRALVELRAGLPQVALTLVGVSHGLYDSRDWRHNAVNFPRLAREWAKYVVARLLLLIPRSSPIASADRTTTESL